MVQVLSKMCQVFTHLASNAPTLSKKDAFAGISGMAEKLPDTKIKAHAYEALSTMAEVRRPARPVFQGHLALISAAWNLLPCSCNAETSSDHAFVLRIKLRAVLPTARAIPRTYPEIVVGAYTQNVSAVSI